MDGRGLRLGLRGLRLGLRLGEIIMTDLSSREVDPTGNYDYNKTK